LSSVAAVSDRLLQQGLKALQVGDLGFDADKVILSHVPHLAARLERRFAQRDQATDSVNAEPEFARSADKSQPLGVLGLVAPMAALSSGRRRHQPDAFIIAHGLQVHPGAEGQAADG